MINMENSNYSDNNTCIQYQFKSCKVAIKYIIQCISYQQPVAVCVILGLLTHMYTDILNNLLLTLARYLFTYFLKLHNMIDSP